MKRNWKKWLIGIAIVAVILIVILWGWNHFFKAQNEESEEDEDAYKTFELYEQDPIAVKGVVELAVNDNYTYKEELGTIDTVHVEDGQTVEKGQALYTYRKSSGAEQNAVNEASRQVKQLTAQRDRLVAQGPGTLPADDEDLMGTGQDMQAAFDNQVAELNDQIDSAQSALDDATSALTTTITAAHAGKVTIDDQGRTDASTPFMHVLGDDVFVKGSVNEYEFYALEKDRSVTLNVNATGETVKGVITRYDQVPPATEAPATTNENAAASDFFGGDMGGTEGGSSTSTTFGFTVKPDDYIQPGFSVEMLIEVPGIEIPESAIIEEDDETFVFVYDHGKAHKRAITLKKQGLNRITTDDFFKPGIRLIENPTDLKDGQKVKVSSDSANTKNADKKSEER